ncbi:MAG: bifunctional folylpolyglutamate synthase/dihydrofolate synthase [Verrucomicrobiae bacterium]|nr:bifunctional folylpolyglutamate synthase/dihydrofolate synthase [Verrucomicrobiae bacterium]
MTRAEQNDSYRAAIEFLYGLQWFGARLGLEIPRRLAALAGNPQNKLRFIHVAGTNGKGSTCAMLESIYRAAGLRVGLYTSPHLVSFRERIQVNRKPISEPDVVRLVEWLKPMLAQFGPGEQPTFFEAVTIMALQYFAEQQCELVIWETGLGGRLDATNIVTPLASVITNIQFDHQRWLGDTLAKIAAEKAGIIKPGVPCITGAEEPEALAVIQETALLRGSQLILVTPAHTQHPPLDQLQLPLLGWHQRMNAAVAVATVRALQHKLPVSESSVRTGLMTVQWPGRMQLVEVGPSKRFVLDGAHNSGGATALRAALEEHFPEAKPTLILGVMQDKDWDLMCEILAPVAGRIICARINSPRSADPTKLAAASKRTNPTAEVRTCESLADALRAAEPDQFVVVAGSLYLIGEAMELLGLVPVPNSDEKKLNEWTVNAPKPNSPKS